MPVGAAGKALGGAREALDGCRLQLPLAASGDTEGGPREGQFMKRQLGLQYTTWEF